MCRKSSSAGNDVLGKSSYFLMITGKVGSTRARRFCSARYLQLLQNEKPVGVNLLSSTRASATIGPRTRPLTQETRERRQRSVIPCPTMTIQHASSSLAVAAALALGCAGASALAQPRPGGAELLKPGEISGIQPHVLLRAGVPNVPSQLLIVSRTTYEPGVRFPWHRHNSQIVFYILQGAMDVQDKGSAPFTLKAGESLLIRPGTTHQHWNASATEPLVFLEFVLVEKGQPSAVLVK